MIFDIIISAPQSSVAYQIEDLVQFRQEEYDTTKISFIGVWTRRYSLPNVSALKLSRLTELNQFEPSRTESSRVKSIEPNRYALDPSMQLELSNFDSTKSYGR